MLWLDGPFGPQWFSRVEVATTMVGRSRAKSFGADLEGNKSFNHSRFAAIESIANEVKLKA